jgi:hypothetical protein
MDKLGLSKGAPGASARVAADERSSEMAPSDTAANAASPEVTGIIPEPASASRVHHSAPSTLYVGDGRGDLCAVLRLGR